MRDFGEGLGALSKPANDTWTHGTVGYHLVRGDEITAYCGNHRCSRNATLGQRARMPGPYPPHGMGLDLSRLDPSLTFDDLRQRLACRYCGERQASIRLNPNAPGTGAPGGNPPRPRGVPRT